MKLLGLLFLLFAAASCGAVLLLLTCIPLAHSEFLFKSTTMSVLFLWYSVECFFDILVYALSSLQDP